MRANSAKSWINSLFRGFSSPTTTDNVLDDLNWAKFNYGDFAHRNRLQKNQTDSKSFKENLQKNAPPAVSPMWHELSDESVEKGIEALSSSVTIQRMQRFHSVLEKRTNAIRFVFENPANVNNVWAALRTFDALGLQYTDIILGDAYTSDNCRKEMASSMGCQKYLSLFEHHNTESCLIGLKKQGYRIAVADIHHPASVPLSAIDFGVNARSETSVHNRTAIVLGNEVVGASQVARDLADVHFFLPMRGFAESLNLSAFCALVCGSLDTTGVLSSSNANGRIEKSEQARILLTWLARTAPGSMLLLKRAGLNISHPKLWDKIGNYTTKP